MRSSESVGVYELRLVNVDSRSSRCHAVVRVHVHTHIPEGKRILFPTPVSLPVSPDTYAISSPFLFLTFFSPATSVHPLSIRCHPPLHVYTHTPGLTLSATTSSTPLESFDIGDVGKYTSGGRIYRIFFSTREGGQTKNFNRDSKERERERGVIIASKRIFAKISRFQGCVVKIVYTRG